MKWLPASSLLWKWIGAAAVLLAVVFVIKLYAGAIARADVHAERVEELRVTLEALALDTVAAGARLDSLADRNAARTRLDSAVIVRLRNANRSLGLQIVELEAEERASAEALDDALGALAARLGPEDLPLLRRVREGQQALVSALRGQIAARDEQLALRVEEIGLVRADRNAQVEEKRAALILLGGLRSVIVQHGLIDVEQKAEIESLRAAVAPGFITRIGQNLELVGITAAVTATVVFLVR